MTLLYRSTATDLATVRSAAPDPALITRLSLVLAQSRVWLTGTPHVRTGDVRRYLTQGLPAALYRVRWWGVGVWVAVAVLAVVSGVHTLHSPEALALVGPPEVRAQIAEAEFASYYTEYDNTSFAASVWTNNAWLAVQCVVFGITGVFPLILMYNTVIQLGVAGAVMAEHGMLGVFFGLLIPHGLLELSAVFVAAGTGLRLFWTMLVPGPRTRARALAEEGLVTLGVALGLTVVLGVSGLIEGYVTPAAFLPWWVKIAVGVVAFAAFWMYVFVAGREATRVGATGGIEADFQVEQAPVAA